MGSDCLNPDCLKPASRLLLTIVTVATRTDRARNRLGRESAGLCVRLTCTFGVEVNGLEPSASTLRIQTGPSAELGIFEKTQVDHHFDRPLLTNVDPCYPSDRARIARRKATATTRRNRDAERWLPRTVAWECHLPPGTRS